MRTHQEFRMRQYIHNELTIYSRTLDFQPENIEGTGPIRMILATRTFQKPKATPRQTYRDPGQQEKADQESFESNNDSSDEGNDTSASQYHQWSAKPNGKGKAKITRRRTRVKRVLPDDISEAFKIPEGNGLDLSDQQLKLLMKLNRKDIRKRAFAVFRSNGQPRNGYERLGTRRRVKTVDEKENRRLNGRQPRKPCRGTGTQIII